MSTRFFTNQGTQTLFEKLKGVFENNPDIQLFDALIGYLRASGYFPIRPYLEKVPHIRVLVGINVDAIMADYHRRGFLFLSHHTHILGEVKNSLPCYIQTPSLTHAFPHGTSLFLY